MSAHRLRLASLVGDERPAPEDMLWRPPPLPSSVASNLGPDLQTALGGPRAAGLSAVPEAHIDLVRLAALVFFCDRTTARPRSMSRSFELDVPVSDAHAWSAEAGAVANLLGLLTGDKWRLRFSVDDRGPDAALDLSATLFDAGVVGHETAGSARGSSPDHEQAGGAVVLFSGGADSTAGAVAAQHAGVLRALASHYEWSSVAGQQKRTIAALEQHAAICVPQRCWRLARRSQASWGGPAYGQETSRRSRSMLFLAWGTAVAAATDAELWVAENGFTSLNPPLSGERRGALSTRTTHPALLRGFQDLLERLGLRTTLRNPFAGETKGASLRRVRDVLGPAAASQLLSVTHSCAAGRVTERGFATDTHCGVCMGCLVRRGAFLAAGIADDTVYLESALPDDRRDRWLGARRARTLSAVRYRIAAGYEITDLLALGLPDDDNLDLALEIARTGMDELRSVVETIR